MESFSVPRSNPRLTLSFLIPSAASSVSLLSLGVVDRVESFQRRLVFPEFSRRSPRSALFQPTLNATYLDSTRTIKNDKIITRESSLRIIMLHSKVYCHALRKIHKYAGSRIRIAFYSLCPHTLSCLLLFLKTRLQSVHL